MLGTLDADERAQADALVLFEPDFAEAVRRWERRLGELNVLVTAVEPSGGRVGPDQGALPNVPPSRGHPAACDRIAEAAGARHQRTPRPR